MSEKKDNNSVAQVEEKELSVMDGTPKGKISKNDLMDSKYIQDVLLGVMYKCAESTRASIKTVEKDEDKAEKLCKSITNQLSSISAKWRKGVDFDSDKGKDHDKAISALFTAEEVSSYIAKGSSVNSREKLDAIQKILGVKTTSANKTEDRANNVMSVLGFAKAEEAPVEAAPKKEEAPAV